MRAGRESGSQLFQTAGPADRQSSGTLVIGVVIDVAGMFTMIHSMIVVMVNNDRMVISMIVIVIDNAARGKQRDGCQGE